MSKRRISGLTAPAILQQRIERTAAAWLRDGNTHAVDFLAPAGAAALFSPESVSWRVFNNPVALFVGGVAAVILELAEPRVRAGVWDHSRFRADPVRRLKRTGLAAMVTVFAPADIAQSMIASVRRAHEAVVGETDSGEPYRASDPELLRWVHATAGYGFAEAYGRYVDALAPAAMDAFYAEGAPIARLYGAADAPLCRAEMDALFRSMADRLQPSPALFTFLDVVRRAPILPQPIRAIQKLMVRAAVQLTPAWLRDRLGLTPAHGLRRWEAPLVREAGRLADRMMLDSSPAVQSCVRLGLPPDYLFVNRRLEGR